MRLIQCCFFALGLAACSTPTKNLSTTPDNTAAVQQAQADMRLAAQDVRRRLVDACTVRDPAKLNGSSQLNPIETDLRSCFRDKLTSAFANSDGTKHCAGKADLGDYVTCLTFGDWLNTLRHNAGSPKSLSTDEWRDPQKAVDNTVNEVGAQTLVQCAGKTAQQFEACQLDILVNSLGVSANDVVICKGQKELECLATRGVAQYLRDKSLMIW